MIHIPLITGLGVTTAIGQNKIKFLSALLNGEQKFAPLMREGRLPPAGYATDTVFIGAEIDTLELPEFLTRRVQRSASFSAQVALVTLDEAWQDAKLDEVKKDRIGLIVGGSNLQQRELIVLQNSYRENPGFMKPSYALQYMDTDICGFCSELFGIHGFAYTLGAASASGQMAVIQAADAVASGQVDVCIALGALADLSYWECIAFRSAGAMSSHASTEARLLCRPFDQLHSGFIFGEACGAVVIESLESAKKRRIKTQARISGWGIVNDGNRSSDPSLKGEVDVIKKALRHAGLSAKDIDYVNPHGTASIIGDEIEANALVEAQLSHAFINTTKSITGHGLAAAGAVEIVATVLQMQAAKLHPSLNLDQPINNTLNWIKNKAIEHKIRNSLNLSMGFGGINTAVCITKFDS